MNAAPFIQAIIEHPDDDLAREVFADWLEEQGEVDRATFIRLECQAARLPFGPERASLEDQARRLRWRHEEDWLGPLHRMSRWWRWSRGMVEEGSFQFDRFVRHASTLFALAPIRRATIRSSGSQVPALIALPGLARLTHLDLSDNRMGDEGASFLAIGRCWRRLTFLRLGHNNITNVGARALAESAELAALTVLDLTHNPITDEGALAFVTSQHFSGTFLGLDENRLSTAAVQQLRGRYQPLPPLMLHHADEAARAVGPPHCWR